MSEDKNCFFCGSECQIDPVPRMHSVKKYECTYCGLYLLDDFLIACASHINETKNKFKIACVLNERRLRGLGGIAFSGKTDKDNKVCSYPQISSEDILDEFPKRAIEVFNRTLLNLSRLSERPFDLINRNKMKADERLLLFTPNRKACDAFLLALAEQGFIRFNVGASTIFSLTIKFWVIVESLQKEEVDNKRAFVAMWFDESMDVYYKSGIKDS